MARLVVSCGSFFKSNSSGGCLAKWTYLKSSSLQRQSCWFSNCLCSSRATCLSGSERQSNSQNIPLFQSSGVSAFKIGSKLLPSIADGISWSNQAKIVGVISTCSLKFETVMPWLAGFLGFRRISGICHDGSKYPPFPHKWWSPNCSPWSLVKMIKVSPHCPVSFSKSKNVPRSQSTSVINPK